MGLSPVSEGAICGRWRRLTKGCVAAPSLRDNLAYLSQWAITASLGCACAVAAATAAWVRLLPPWAARPSCKAARSARAPASLARRIIGTDVSQARAKGDLQHVRAL